MCGQYNGWLQLGCSGLVACGGGWDFKSVLSMSKNVQRFIVKAHPTDAHRQYYRWQTATICVLVGEDDRKLAFETAKKAITKNHWIPIGAFEKATLIEGRIRSVGGDVWTTYLEVLQGKTKVIEIVDQPTASKESPLPILAPKVTETFVDSVIIKAGGCRFVPTGQASSLPRNADYVIDDYIFELKTLEDESLEVLETQNKLARLFRDAFPDKSSILLDPSRLPLGQQKIYLDIVRKRIARLVHSASGQIRETKEQIADKETKGGLILLNCGFNSLFPPIFEDQAERCVKQSSQIDCVICVSVWLLTNGFESTMNFEVHPKSSKIRTVEKITKAFWEREEEWMTEWGRSGFVPPSKVTNPMKPVAFEREGIIFSFIPPSMPDKRFTEES